jgi:hypothetical protein
MIAPPTLDVVNRPKLGPKVTNPDGSVSTVKSMSIGTDQGEVLIPMVSPDGRLLDERGAVDLYRRTGQHLGIFQTPDAATRYAIMLHKNQEAQGQTLSKFHGH